MLVFGVFLRESAPTAAKSRTNLSTNSGKATKRLGRLAPYVAHSHVQIHMGMDIRQTNCPSRRKGGTWAGGGGLGGQQFKRLGKLSDWHQLCGLRLWIHLGMDIGHIQVAPQYLRCISRGGRVDIRQTYYPSRHKGCTWGF